MDYDGSVEFYGILLVAGFALLGVWEMLKWTAHKLFDVDEATVAKARREDSEPSLESRTRRASFNECEFL